MSEPSPGDEIYFHVGSDTYFGKFKRAIQTKNCPYYEIESQGALIKVPKSYVVSVNPPREQRLEPMWRRNVS